MSQAKLQLPLDKLQKPIQVLVLLRILWNEENNVLFSALNGRQVVHYILFSTLLVIVTGAKTEIQQIFQATAIQW